MAWQSDRTPLSSRYRHRSVDLWLYALINASALVLQLAWARQLIALVGSAVGSVSVMLALLMGGFALGAWADRSLADRARHPGRLLAALYGLAGASAIVTLFVDRFITLGRIAAALPGATTDQAAVATLLMATPLHLAPVICIGAAFPVLVRRVMADGVTTSTYGLVLLAQTAGSVVGALLGGFVLLRYLGIDATILTTGIACIAAGGIALMAARGHHASTAEDADTAEGPHTASADHAGRVRRAALIALTLSGAATFIYEVAWSRELLLVFGSSVYANAIMLASVLIGLGFGQWLGRRKVAGAREGLARASSALWLAAAAGLLSVALARLAPILYTYAHHALPGSLLVFAAVQAAASVATIVAPATLIGFASPTLMRLATTADDERGRQSGIAYAVNTLGAMAGALAGGFILLPMLTAKGTAGVAAVLQVAAAIVLWRASRRSVMERGRVAALAGALAVGLAAFVLAEAADPLLSFSLAGDGYETPSAAIDGMRQVRTVYYRDAAQGRVTVYIGPGGSYVLKGSGMTEGSQGAVDDQTMGFVVYLPAAYLSQPRNALVIGLGTGTTSARMLGIEGIERVETVEINPAMVEASRFFVGDALASDARSHMLITDARTHLAATGSTYDLIVSEPSYPLSPFSAQMFTRESFELMRHRLEPDGVVCQWLPAYLMQDRERDLMLKTFASVFPNSHVWATEVNGRVSDAVLIGINGNGVADSATIEERLTAGPASEYEWRYLGGADKLQLLLDDPAIPLNTDDRPLLEYWTPLRQIEMLWRR